MSYITSPRYDVLLTPKLHATKIDDAEFDVQATHVVQPPSKQPRLIWNLAHWFIGSCMLLALAAAMVFHLPWYKATFYSTVVVWWGGDPSAKNSGHYEMVQPTYFFLGIVLPIAAAALLFPLIQGSSLPIVVTPLSHWLHSKPQAFGYRVSCGELLFVAILLVSNVFAGYYQYTKRTTAMTSSSDSIKNAGIALGYMSMFNLTFLVLPATRQSFWMAWFNIPYANGVKYHRWIGVATLVALVMHVGIIVAYYANINSLVTLLPCWDCDLASAEGTDRWQNVFGFLAFICVGVVALTSLPYVRRNHYEVFRTAHFLFVPAAIFASMHRVPILYSVFASLVLYLINHMYSRETTRAPISVARATAMPADVIELTFHTTTHYAPGGTVWVRVPALSHSQWHPFSIASSPLHTPGLVTIYVKCLGNWTTGLYHYIQECKRKRFPPLMYLDGGSAFTASRTTMVPSAYRHVLFIAGGIGVTVLMGQITHALYTTPHKTVWLVWHVRQSEMLLQFHDWLRDLEALASMNGSRLYIRLHVTRDPLAIFNVSDHHKGIVPCFDVHAKPVEATPQANLSFARRTWMALLAFVCSGGLLTLALYGNALQTAQGNYWPLQRFVACCAVVGGCAVAYFVVSAASSVLPSQQLPVDMTTLPPKPATDTVLFLLKYNVQTIRVDWTVLLNEIQQQIALDDMVGVFVSGPKPLIRDVDDNIQGRPTFHVHHHHFLI